MGEQTNIAWTQRTWNPFQGCHKVSAGCRGCYMFSEKIRYGQTPNVVIRSKPPTFNAPLKWKEPALVFTCSWSDWFIEEADPWRAEAWDIVRRTPHLTYQILTKRPERIAACLPGDWGHGWPNVWLGVSVEDQAAANERIPVLMTTPAALRFVSAEPLLGSVNLRKLTRGWREPGHTCEREVYPLDGMMAIPDCDWDVGKIAWVIVGGESGPRARPCAEEWIRSIVEQCRGSGVPAFVKQLGAYVVSEHRTAPAEMMAHPERLTAADRAPNGEVWAWRAGLAHPKGGDPAEWPEDLCVQQFPGQTEAPRG
jgi:protein gp37